MRGAAKTFSSPKPGGTACGVVRLACKSALRLAPSPFYVVRATLSHSLDALIHLVVVLSGKHRAACNENLVGGLWQPQTEQISIQEAVVLGSIPEDLHGMFVTIGPSALHPPVGGFHIFDGDGALRAVRFTPGKASFAFNHLHTEKYLAEQRLGYSRAISLNALRGVSGLCILLLSKLRKFVQNDQYADSPANTNVVVHGGSIFAMWEGALPYRLKLDAAKTSLQCAGRMEIDYKRQYSAHPVIHRETGRMFAVSYTLDSKEQDANIVVVDKECTLVRTVPLHLGRKPMIHDAAITKKYVLVFDYPLLFEPENIVKKGEIPFCFHSELKTRFGLFPVDGYHENQIQWFECDACISFHSVCAWDEGSKVILLLTRYSEINLSAAGNEATQNGSLHRYELDTATGTVSQRELVLDLSGYAVAKSKFSVDFPVVNREYYGGPVQYLYLSCMRYSSKRVMQCPAVVKYDTKADRVAGCIELEDGADAIGEALFVPKQGGKSEDDGYILAFVRDVRGHITLDVYDASTMTNKRIVQVSAPEGYRVPNGFHSEFIPDALLQS